MKPRLLDLFCGAGGCSMGYSRAGFEVTGVDIKPQPRYPFASVRADALEYLAEFGGLYDVIHASPPCQAYSRLKSIKRFNPTPHPELINPVRELLQQTAKPWVIENVPGSCLGSAIILCGSMFGLGSVCRDGSFHQLRRHRVFESSMCLLQPHCQHVGRPVGVYGDGGGRPIRASAKGINGFTGNSEERRNAMGIDWMNRYEISQAIPPAYTEYIGNQLMRIMS